MSKPKEILIAALALAAAAPVSRAHADSALLPGIPDFDQERTYHVVPGIDNGSMYCGPAAATDIMYYLAEHGFVHLTPFGHNENDFDTVSQSIWWMGQWMQTDTVDGTGHGDVQSGLQQWTGLYSFVPFVIDDFDDIKPAYLREFMREGLIQGNVIVHFGYYDHKASGDYWRTGGHYVALDGWNFSASGNQLIYRDPSNNSSLSTQAAYVNEYELFNDVQGSFCDDHGNSCGTRSKMRKADDPETFVDGILVILPAWGLSNHFTSIHVPASVTSPDSETTVDIRPVGTTPTGPITDIATSAASMHALMTFGGSNSVWDYDLATMTERALVTFASPPQRVAYGKAFNAFVALSGSIVAIDRDGNQTSSRTVVGSIDGMVYEPARGRLAVVSRSSGLVRYYDDELTFLGSDPLPTLSGSGRLSVDVDVTTGALWAHVDGSRVLTRMFNNSDGGWSSANVTLSTTGTPEGLMFSELGDRHLLVEEGGVLKEYGLDGTPSSTTPFVGTAAGNILAMPRLKGRVDNVADDAGN